LSLETQELQQRTIKEVIALAFMNQAARAWHHEDSKAAISLYEKGLKFMPNDPLIQTFLGFQYLFNGETEKGRTLLEKVKKEHPEMNSTTDTIIEDYLAGRATAQGIQAIFQEVNETRTSILEKQKELEAIVAEFPKFRGAVFHLAVTYLQLGREKEAIPILEKYMGIDPTSPTVCYYLSALHAQRMNYNAAWKYLKATETLLKAKGHSPRTLEELRANLQRACPEPI
jgi:predicted Zn-dependent protease